MPSPDVRGYVDLTVEDRTPQDLVRAALTEYESWLPGITLEEGHTEAVLIEAFALQLAELVYRVNRLPGALTEVLLRLFGMTRSLGVAPVTTLTVTTSGAFRVEAPPGTRFLLTVPGGYDPVVFRSDSGFVVAAAATTATVPVTAERATDDANGIAAGTAVALLDAVAGVESAVLAAAVTGGLDPEDGAAFLNRGAARLARLTDALVLPAQFTAAVVEDPRYPQATTVDNYDGGGGTPGTHPGHVTVAALKADGTFLSGGEKTALVAVLAAKTLANLTVHAVDPTITNVPVAATVRARPGYTSGEIIANVEGVIRAVLDPLTWDFTPTVYRLDLVAAIDAQAAGVARVEQVLLNGAEANVTLPGAAPLPNDGTLTVTVTGP